MQEPTQQHTLRTHTYTQYVPAPNTLIYVHSHAHAYTPHTNTSTNGMSTHTRRHAVCPAVICFQSLVFFMENNNCLARLIFINAFLMVPLAGAWILYLLPILSVCREFFVLFCCSYYGGVGSVLLCSRQGRRQQRSS